CAKHDYGNIPGGAFDFW
nr:immunoglobulin heavy chain junction region [Macaca mulatta]MOW78204.1 immunoglobulin heavy chain junction region [Macaca mulatta]